MSINRQHFNKAGAIKHLRAKRKGRAIFLNVAMMTEDNGKGRKVEAHVKVTFPAALDWLNKAIASPTAQINISTGESCIFISSHWEHSLI